VTAIICGVDVSGKNLDVCIGRERRHARRFGNSPDGIAKLVAFCRQHQVELVVMEATGGYERLAFALLWQAKLPTAIVNPRQVRRFAEAMGLFEKTDPIDAGVLAWFAEARHIVAHAPPSEAQARLAALVTRLHQLVEHRVAHANQRRLVQDADVLKSFTNILAAIAREIRSLEAKIVELIGEDPLWRALDAAFRSIKGVAGRTVARLLAELPEIGTLSGKAVAKLTGLAPIARDSGTLSGRRAVRGGREGVRSILFVVVEVVRRYDPDFREAHQKLRAKGKPPKVVRTALARRLLVILNAKARDVRNELAAAT
jgi:transposase